MTPFSIQVTASAVTVDLQANKLTKQQAAKLLSILQPWQSKPTMQPSRWSLTSPIACMKA